MPSTTKLDFADRLLADDEQVLEEILGAFGPAILAVLARKYRGVLGAHDLEDLLSIGLYRLWTHRTRFELSRGSLRAWFFQIVDNAARDVLRHGWIKARQREVSWTAVESHPFDGAFTSRHVGNGRRGHSAPKVPSSLEQQICEIVDALPSAQQAILNADAKSPEGKASSQQLAEELKLPASTVRVYRKRALERVRSELERRGFRELE